MRRSLVYLCSYSDYDMWKARFPDRIIFSDPFCPIGLLLRSDGQEQIGTDEYWKSRERIALINQYNEEMLADGTGD